MTTIRGGVSRTVIATALATALLATFAPAASAATYDDTLGVNATYSGPGVGYDGVLDGHSAGTNTMSVGGTSLETFCIQYGIDADSVSGAAFKSLTWKDSGVKGLAKAAGIAATHASKGALSDAKAENAAAQLAIWSFTDSLDYTKVPNATITARAAALIAAATDAAPATGTYAVNVTTTPIEGDQTRVEVRVLDSAGAPVPDVSVMVSPQDLPSGQVSADVAVTSAAGIAQIDVDSPDAKILADVDLTTTMAAGTVLKPGANKQQVITAKAAKVTMRFGQAIELLPPVTATPDPTPTATPTPTPVATPVATTPTPAATPAAAKPTALPYTGGLGTTGLFAGLLAAAGAAGFGALVLRRRARSN